jgi:hypothetical protein
MKLLLLLLAAWISVTFVVVWVISLFLRAREERERAESQRRLRERTAAEEESHADDKRIA